MWTSFKGAKILNSKLLREFLHFATKAMFTKMWDILRVEKMKIWITSNADYSTFLISQMTKLLLPQIPLVGEELALSNLQF